MLMQDATLLLTGRGQIARRRTTHETPGPRFVANHVSRRHASLGKTLERIDALSMPASGKIYKCHECKAVVANNGEDSSCDPSCTTQCGGAWLAAHADFSVGTPVVSSGYTVVTAALRAVDSAV